MSVKDILSAAAGLLFLAGYVPYIISIFRGNKPAKASWLIWVSLDTISLVAMYYEKTVNGQILGTVAGAWVVTALAMKYGKPGWSNLDKFCLVGAVVGIALWQYFDSPVLGLVTSQAVTFLGSVPTFVSAWKDPSQEDRFAWTLYWLSCVAAMFAIPSPTIAHVTQPTTFFIIESVMMYLLFVRKRVRIIPVTD